MESLVRWLIGLGILWGISYIIKLFRKGVHTVNKIPNEIEKTEYLLNQYGHLNGKIDEIWEKEVLDVTVKRPISEKGEWVVYKCIKTWNPINLTGEPHELYRISDVELSQIIKK